MDGLGHGDPDPALLEGPAFVHADDICEAFARKILGEFVDGHHRGAGGLGDGDGFAEVVGVAVSHQDERYRSQGRDGGLQQRVAEPGVDEDTGAVALQFHGGMAVKGNFDAFPDSCGAHGVLL